MPRKFFLNKSIDTPYSAVEAEDYKEVEESEANIVGSVTADGTHLPIFDLDFPCRLVESSTPGHFHLFADKPISAEALFDVLDAMAKAGLIESFYAKASRIRGFASARYNCKKKV